MSEFTIFLADCWRMFEEVQVPVLNISFAKLYLGAFVVGISIVILRPLLGIGAGGVSNIMHGLSRKRGYDRAYSKRAQSQRYIMPKNPSPRDYQHQPWLPPHNK